MPQGRPSVSGHRVATTTRSRKASLRLTVSGKARIATGTGGRAVVDDTVRRVTQLSVLAQSLASASDEDARLALAVRAAVAVVEHCDHAGIACHTEHGLVTRASTDDVGQRADHLQNEFGEGPCLDVVRTRETLVIPDFQQETRWATWARRVRDELDVGSMMSLLLFTDQTSYGALNLYTRRGTHFDADDLAIGQALAAHISVIVAAERQIDHLGLAMRNRNTIGQAQGMLMERLQINADQALNYLRRASSNTNRKLVHIAKDIASTRRLPEL